MMTPKFRAYIKDLDDLELDFTEIPHEGHFVYGNLIKGETYSDTDAIVGNLIEVTDEYINPQWWCSIEKGSAEQSTGLKDVYGEEIYEGDIVHGYDQEPDRDDGYIGGSVTDVVNFKYGAFWIGDIWYKVMVMTPPIVEVIGNVHENPELLEADE